jgi:hypothetical protein
MTGVVPRQPVAERGTIVSLVGQQFLWRGKGFGKGPGFGPLFPRAGSALSALDGLTYDASMVAKDHGQHAFHQSFEQFAGRMVNSYRL